MGRARRAAGPIAFMPSDGNYLGAKDLQGLPTGANGIRLVIRVVEVLEHPAGEEVNGRQLKAFWSIVFERPNREWLLAPWDAKPKSSEWERSKKEWKFGSDVARRLIFRVGADASRWAGAIIPIRLEATTFGREDVWGVRPVPLAWESNPDKRREAMRLIAEGTYQPPALPRSEQPPAPAGPALTVEREPGADEGEPPPDDFDQRTDADNTEPPEDWQPGTT